MMATNADWAAAYARQAKADFATYNAIKTLDIPECHKLQFLQMPCEKLVKSHLWEAGNVPHDVDTSHAVVAKHLPRVLKQALVYTSIRPSQAKEILKHTRRLAEQIDVLAPAVDRDGRRPDNCEYPWEDTRGVVHSPLDCAFHPTQLLVAPAGRAFLKLLSVAIDALTSAPSEEF